MSNNKRENIQLQKVALMRDNDDNCNGNAGSLSYSNNMKEMSNLHDISQKKATRKIAIACLICVTFMIIEIVAAIWSNSLSLMTDASHLFCDICSFALNLFSIYISDFEGNVDMSFGYHRAEIIGALFSIFFIWALSAYILYSSVFRLFHVKIVNGYIMFVTAFVSTLANIFTAFILKIHTHGFDLDHHHCSEGHNHHHRATHNHNHNQNHNHNHDHNHNHNHNHDHSHKNSLHHSHTNTNTHDVELYRNYSLPHDHIFIYKDNMKEEKKEEIEKGKEKEKEKENVYYESKKNTYIKLKEKVISGDNHIDENGNMKWDKNKTTASNCEYVAFDYYQNISQKQMEADELKMLMENCCKGDEEDTRQNYEKMEENKKKKTENKEQTEKEGRDKQLKKGREKEKITYKEKYQEYERQEPPEQNQWKRNENNLDRYSQQKSMRNSVNNKKGRKTKGNTNKNLEYIYNNHDKENDMEKKRQVKNNMDVLCNPNEHLICSGTTDNSIEDTPINFIKDKNNEYASNESNKNESFIFFLSQNNVNSELEKKTNKESNIYSKSQWREKDSFSNHTSKEIVNINLKAAYIHALSDLIQNIGVIIASLIIWFNPQYSVVDPICSIIFCFIVFSTTISVIKEVLNVLMEGTPEGLNLIELKNDLLSIRGVIDIHDLHVWSLSIGKPALACHIVTHKNNAHAVLKYATSLCQNKYKILHTTVQTDYPSNVSNCETYAHLKCSNLKLIT